MTFNVIVNVLVFFIGLECGTILTMVGMHRIQKKRQAQFDKVIEAESKAISELIEKLENPSNGVKSPIQLTKLK